MKKINRYLTTLGCLLGVGSSTLLGVQINEIRIDEPGASDSNEFAELKGNPGESLDGLWYLVIGDHTAFGSDDGQNIPDKRGGVVEFAVSLDGLTIPDDGLFLIASVNMQIDVLGLEASDVDLLLTEINFENSDNVTHMLVRGYTGIEVTNFADQYDDLAVDIDDTDDGVPNATLPWTEILDAVGVVAEPNDSDPEEYTYGEAFGFVDIGPDGSFAPGMVYRGGDDGLWNIGEFNLINEAGDGLFMGDDQNGPAMDTPGAPNPNSPEPVITPSILGFSPSTVQPGDTVSVSGQNFGGTTSVTVGGIEATFTVVDAETLEIQVDGGLASGPIEITTPAGVATSSSDLTIIGGGTTVLAFEDFEEGLGEFTAISVASDADWEHGTFGGNGFAEISGFGADVASDDWLISPAVDLGGANSPTLSFATARNFGGPDLEILIASDYDGLNPANATWTPVEAPLSEGSYDLVSSGEIDLSAYIGETIHVAFRYTSTGTESGDGAVYQVHEFLVQDSAAGSSIVFLEDFEEDLGEFTAISVASNEDWAHGTFGGNGFAEISGFGADVASDDWLISPAIDLAGTNEPTLSFTTARNFGGPELEVLISSNYDGLNPADATWTAVTAPLSEGGYELVSSGEIDLADYVGETIHVAFRYTSTGTGSGEGAVYQVHEMLVQDTVADVSLLLFEDFEADLGNFAAISVASDADWEHGTFGGNGFAEISGFGADAASDDWLISPAVDLAGASSPVLSFTTARNFGGPELEVLISSDYDGLNPANATWTAVTAPLSEGSYELVSSGDIGLSDYVGETIHVAFRYTSTGTGSGEGAVYQVHEVLITDGAGFTPGWVKDPVLSWIYEYTPDWAYSVTMGVINTEAFPWIYQVSFGYIYIPDGTDIEAGAYVVVDGDWAWVQAGLNGWFVNLAGEWDNFITPQE